MAEKKLHYGWFVCIGATLMLFVNIGITSNCFAAFAPYLVQMRGFTNTQISLLTTIRFSMGIISMLGVNIYYEKTGIRLGMGITMLLSTTSIVLCAYAKSYTLMLFATFISGICYGLGGFIPVSIVISRWFKSRKAFALSICSAGTGLATMIMPHFISGWVESYGLKVGFLLVAAIMVVLSAVSILLVRSDPQEMGLGAFVCKENEKTKAAPKSPNKSIDKGFALMFYLSIALIGIASGGATQSMTLLYTTNGFSAASAAAALSMYGLTLTAGKFIYGLITDRIGVYKSNYLYMFGSSFAVLLCCFVFTGNAVFMYSSALLIGITFPFNTIGLPMWGADLFCESDYAKAVKNSNMTQTLAIAVFAPLPGIIADRWGYLPSFILYTACMFAAAVLMQTTYVMRLKKKSEVNVL